MNSLLLGTRKTGTDFVKYVAEIITKAKGFEKTMEKVNIIDGGHGKCRAEFTVLPEHLNDDGHLHGGFTATIVDMMTTFALLSKPSFAGVSVSLCVSHVKAAKEGDDIIVDANCIRAGRKLAFIDCILRDRNDGSLIARGNQIKFVDTNTMDKGATKP